MQWSTLTKLNDAMLDQFKRVKEQVRTQAKIHEAPILGGKRPEGSMWGPKLGEVREVPN